MVNHVSSVRSLQSWSLLLTFLIAVLLVERSWGFTTRQSFGAVRRRALFFDSTAHFRTTSSRRMLETEFLEADDDDDDDDEDDDEVVDPYQSAASSEFVDEPGTGNRNRVIPSDSPEPTTNIDWGGALSTLRARVGDVESGKSQDPPHVLFRLMSTQTPNQVIGSFVNTANPQVVQAMSGAVGSLLGGLSTPMSGMETVVKATGDKVASLCFQLQMTGYLFRNAEYVLALKDLMDLRGSATLEEYKDAFDKLDKDGSGYIESSEIEDLLSDIYDGKTPDFEVKAFLNFFDENNDGKVSWEEFQRGLMGMVEQTKKRGDQDVLLKALPGDDDDAPAAVEPRLSGTIEIELEDGRVVEVDADEYVTTLKAEAKALKEALRREKGIQPLNGSDGGVMGAAAGASPPSDADAFGGIANYIASRQGDVKALTEGISPDIVKTMKMLVDFVLEGGQSGKAKGIPKEEMEMEIPGSALQQLALWQLILGYRLRESEAKGDYLKLLE